MRTFQILTASPYMNADNAPRISIDSYLVAAHSIAEAWKTIEAHHAGQDADAAYGISAAHLTPAAGYAEGIIDGEFDMAYDEFQLWVKLTVASQFDENGDPLFRHPETGAILPDMYIPLHTGPETLLQWATRMLVTPDQYPFRGTQFPTHYKPLGLMERLSPNLLMSEALEDDEKLKSALSDFCRDGNHALNGATVGEQIKEIWAIADKEFYPFNSDETLTQWAQRCIASVLEAKGLCPRPDFHHILAVLDDWPKKVAVRDIGDELTVVIERYSDLTAAQCDSMTVNDVREHLWSLDSKLIMAETTMPNSLPH